MPAPHTWRRYDEISAGLWLGNALAATASLGIADAFGEEPRTIDALAAELGLDIGALERLMRALAANGIFEQVDARTCAHNAMSRFLRADHPFSMFDLLMMTMTAGGRGRTEEEHRELARRAGFEIASIVELGNMTVAELVPV